MDLTTDISSVEWMNCFVMEPVVRISSPRFAAIEAMRVATITIIIQPTRDCIPIFIAVANVVGRSPSKIILLIITIINHNNTNLYDPSSVI